MQGRKLNSRVVEKVQGWTPGYKRETARRNELFDKHNRYPTLQFKLYKK